MAVTSALFPNKRCKKFAVLLHEVHCSSLLSSLSAVSVLCSLWSACEMTRALLLLFLAVLVPPSIVLTNTLTKELFMVWRVEPPEHPGTSHVFLTLRKKCTHVFCCLWQFIPLLKLPRKWAAIYVFCARTVLVLLLLPFCPCFLFAL